MASQTVCYLTIGDGSICEEACWLAALAIRARPKILEKDNNLDSLFHMLKNLTLCKKQFQKDLPFLHNPEPGKQKLFIRHIKMMVTWLSHSSCCHWNSDPIILVVEVSSLPQGNAESKKHDGNANGTPSSIMLKQEHLSTFPVRQCKWRWTPPIIYRHDSGHSPEWCRHVITKDTDGLPTQEYLRGVQQAESQFQRALTEHYVG